MTTFNLADLFELIVDGFGDREALVADDRRLTYAELDERANRLAHHLLEQGIGPGDPVGLQLTNGTEYAEGMLAAFKIRAIPVNVNFRYVAEELRYLYSDADLVAIVVHRAFAPQMQAAMTEALRHVLVVEDASGEQMPGDAADYEEALAAASPERDFGPRSGDDTYIAYTGGTTGMPKGVVWRQEDIFFAGMGGGDPMHAGDHVTAPEQLVERVPETGMVILAIPPFMHVSAHWLLFTSFFGGGTMVVTARFDPARTLELVEQERVNMLVTVGDAICRPLADEIERGERDISSLFVIGSGGAVLSPSTKQRLTELLPNALVTDGYGSSETGTMGRQTNTSGSVGGSRFAMSEDCAVFTEEGTRVEPGSGVVGKLARSGHIPLRYHKDPEKTAATFVELEGKRWVLPGDHATVEDDGTITLLGRGSVVINTGGEKVYPEEVEQVVKEHPAVLDAVVVGVPDERWGERVTTLVQVTGEVTLEEIQELCRAKLAGYKVPRSLVVVDEIVRSPAGKTDYRWARAHAAKVLAAP